MVDRYRSGCPLSILRVLLASPPPKVWKDNDVVALESQVLSCSRCFRDVELDAEVVITREVVLQLIQPTL